MAKKEQSEQTKKPMTLEEYLVSQLDTQVVLKDGTYLKDPVDGHILTKQEAIATNIMNQAMKGDINAVKYINNLQTQMNTRQKIEELYGKK